MPTSMNWRLGVIGVLLIAACSRETVTEKTVAAKKKVADTFDDVAVPWSRTENRQRNEQERFDDRWRQLETFRAQAQRRAARPAPPKVNVTFVSGVKETFDNVTPQVINNSPVSVPIQGDVSGPSVLKTQVYLDRLRFSVGALDGRWGRNSAIATWWFQRSRGLNAAEPGALDEPTFRRLAAENAGAAALVQRTLTEDDVKGPFESIPEDVYDKAKLDCLCYESIGEKLAERFHTTQEFLERINPDVILGELQAGRQIWVPNVREAVTQDNPDIAK